MGSDHTNLEWQMRKLVDVEFESAAAFLRVAATAYGYGNRTRGDASLAKAEQACAEIEHWITRADARGWNFRDLRARLNVLRGEVATVKHRTSDQQPSQAAA